MGVPCNITRNLTFEIKVQGSHKRSLICGGHTSLVFRLSLSLSIICTFSVISTSLPLASFLNFSRAVFCLLMEPSLALMFWSCCRMVFSSSLIFASCLANFPSRSSMVSSKITHIGSKLKQTRTSSLGSRPQNQSINQSINQPTNQSVNQSINRSIDQSMNQKYLFHQVTLKSRSSLKCTSANKL